MGIAESGGTTRFWRGQGQGRNAGSRAVPLVLVVLVGLFAGLTTGCRSLPSLDDRTVSSALTDDEARTTQLGLAIEPLTVLHPGKSGIRLMENPREAFAARVLLAAATQRTLDVEYYIWHGDVTGTLLLEALHNAADRGVRVRLLLDDNGTRGIDSELVTLNQHENFEVRLFNPFRNRNLKPLGFVFEFSRLNRRMHNKSFTADNQATIIGGRNVGDEYFGATAGILKVDLDLLAIGPVVQDVSRDFDRYWASGSAYPVDGIVPARKMEDLESFRSQAAAVRRGVEAQEYIAALRNSTLVAALLEGSSALIWADTTMVTDAPEKGLGKVKGEALLTNQLTEILGEPKRHVELVSPYFVPARGGTRLFSEMAESGIELRVLTNALEATDVISVHAGYAKRRKDLLEAGVRLFEMRHLSPQVDRNVSAGPFGSSASSLHAKTFAVDGERAFIGSFNFDPRSINLNTELGFVIDSPELAQQIADVFDGGISSDVYEVLLDEKGKLYWIEQGDGGLIRHDKEPNTGFWKRSAVFWISLLPIDWML